MSAVALPEADAFKPLVAGLVALDLAHFRSVLDHLRSSLDKVGREGFSPDTESDRLGKAYRTAIDSAIDALGRHTALETEIGTRFHTGQAVAELIAEFNVLRAVYLDDWPDSTESWPAEDPETRAATQAAIDAAVERGEYESLQDVIARISRAG